MLKIKSSNRLAIGLFIGLLVYLVIGLFSPVKAAVLSIQTLPAYVNTANFKISCTSDGASAQFYYSKHGGSWTAFGPAIDLSTNQCLVQADSVVNDQTDYAFKVNVDGTDSAVTSTTFDSSGPSSVSDYKKERINDGKYKLHWINPGDADFDKVIIYRGNSTDFSADAGSEIARVNGSPNSEMTYDDNFAPDAGKTYYYVIRAIDRAGNSSGLVGDGSLSSSNTQPVNSPTGKVTILPKEQGSVLGAQTAATPSSTSTPETSQSAENAGGFNLLTWILGHKKISLGILILAAILGYYIYKSREK